MLTFFFFVQSDDSFVLLSEKTRLVKKSHVQSNCCYPKGRRGDAKSSEDCIEHEHKNTEVEGFFRKREEWMLSSCYCWYLRTDYSLMFFLYIITFLLILHWIMWSEEHRPFSCTSASIYESELVHCQSYNHPLPFCIYIHKKRATFSYTWNMKANWPIWGSRGLMVRDSDL